MMLHSSCSHRSHPRWSRSRLPEGLGMESEEMTSPPRSGGGEDGQSLDV